ncbi:hypothetical protein AX16_010629 [Volvariella volvacea WC 439]|nr:hypothetical protein AX16_010629 [Volvariella volvacea WC 439]
MKTPASHPASTAPGLHKRSKWSRQQLMRKLELLNSLSAPLPPTLPPSPPASRSASPAPGLKRKSDSQIDSEDAKRARKSVPSHSSSQLPQSQPPPPQRHHTTHHTLPSAPISNAHPPNAQSSARSEPEDGEVHEDTCISSSRPPATSAPVVAPPSSALPIRRPRRAESLTLAHYDFLHDKYHNQGRNLKFSGDARFLAAHPPTHKEYRPLAHPIDPNSPYHKYGNLLARLELVDGLICFTYAKWSRDYSRKTCIHEAWSTFAGYIKWCKEKWEAEKSTNSAELAFVGLIYMIEAFISARRMAANLRRKIEPELIRQTQKCVTQVANAVAHGYQASTGTSNVLPSPASLAAPNSANSTPANRDAGSPDASNSHATGQNGPTVTTRPAQQNGLQPLPKTMMPEKLDYPMTPEAMDRISTISLPFTPLAVHEFKETIGFIHTASTSSVIAHKYLNLTVLARSFPNTFARVAYSTLKYNDEAEPEFEDEEGELLWPGDVITGEGLGWVCLLGKAMIKEFGKAYSYRGPEGAIPKPEGSNGGSSSSSTQKTRQEHR